jgi:hypothetical protein
MLSKATLYFVLTCVGAPACLDNQCDQIDDEPVRYTDGHTNAERTFYQSSTRNEPHLRFPAARHFHLEHGLREAPARVDVWVSFNPTGRPESKAAGDQAWVTVTDDHIEIRNKTCADFFLRVEASTEPGAGVETQGPDAAAPDAAPPVNDD